MCGCSSSRSQQTTQTGRAVAPDALSFRVEDMTCGHCAKTIAHAIETRFPGVLVQADPGSKLVSVRGASDLAALMRTVQEAGYRPASVSETVPLAR